MRDGGIIQHHLEVRYETGFELVASKLLGKSRSLRDYCI
jgi:hypothetical protein